MANNIPRVVLDTNILISAYVFGGKPEEILQLAIHAKITPVTSASLVGELVDILRKKFGVDTTYLEQLKEELTELCEIVYPATSIKIARDEEDNKVLETALEGRATYIVSGDNDLLDLKSFKDIPILSAREFLETVENDYKL